MEQRRVREFVDATHATDNESVAIEMLRPLVEDTARLWGCTVSLNLNPPSATVPRKTLNQLSLMLAEIDRQCRSPWCGDDGAGDRDLSRRPAGYRGAR